MLHYNIKNNCWCFVIGKRIIIKHTCLASVARVSWCAHATIRIGAVDTCRSVHTIISFTFVYLWKQCIIPVGIVIFHWEISSIFVPQLRVVFVYTVPMQSLPITWFEKKHVGPLDQLSAAITMADEKKQMKLFRGEWLMFIAVIIKVIRAYPP